MQSYKIDNEKMMREQNQTNAQVMQILNQLHRQANNGSNSRQEERGRHYEKQDNYKRVGHSRSARRTHIHHSPPHSVRKFYAYEDSLSNPKVSFFSGTKEEDMSLTFCKES
jgi:uncharacterized membrane protein YgaE (UPF0421/DUF939 family)